MHKKFSISFMFFFLGLMVFACSADIDSNWKEVKLTESESNIEIDWDSINASIRDNNYYSTESIKEVERIVGFPIKTFKKVPPQIDFTGIVIVDTGYHLDNPYWSVTQYWSYKDEKLFISLSSMVNPEQFPELLEAQEGLIEIEGWQSESIEIEETEVEKFIKHDPNEISLIWYDDEIRYSLTGKINNELNTKVYLKLVESLINL